MTFEENHIRAEDAYLRQECTATAEATVGRMFEAIGYRPGMVIVPADHIEDLQFQIKVIQGAAALAQKSYEHHLAVYRKALDEKPPVWHDDIQSLQERDAIMTDRIETLEAALRDLSTDWDCCAVSKNMKLIARKALEGEDA